MLAFALICLAWLLVVAGGWFLWVAHANRKKAHDALQWINLALKSEGHVTGIRRISVSHFVVPLRMRSPIFRNASVLVEFVHRERPLRWLCDRRAGKLDSITFQADLDCPPNFNFQVQNRRWFAGSRRHLPQDASRWQLNPAEPVVFATRKWQREISVMVNALLSARQQELLGLSFRRKSPHFCATVPLDSVAPGVNCGPGVFTLLREIAAEASAL
jgi:hypothetical protein